MNTEPINMVKAISFINYNCIKHFNNNLNIYTIINNNMEYRPIDHNRFGWCWRNEHGSGKRMTPYFETEELAEKFHEYVDIHSFELTDITPIDIAEIMIMQNKFDQLDLRYTKLSEINELAKDFISGDTLIEDIKNQVVINPDGETMREFYGIDQEKYYDCIIEN
jgi:hypothetical protein